MLEYYKARLDFQCETRFCRVKCYDVRVTFDGRMLVIVDAENACLRTIFKSGYKSEATLRAAVMRSLKLQYGASDFQWHADVYARYGG